MGRDGKVGEGTAVRKCNQVVVNGRKVEEKVRWRPQAERVLALKGQYTRKTKNQPSDKANLTIKTGWKRLVFARELREGGAVFARVGSAVIDPRGEIALDSLAAAHIRRESPEQLNLVAAGGELGANAFRDARLHLHVAAGKGGLGEAGGFEGLLDVHAEVHQVGDELCVGLGLVPAAHDAEGDADVALFEKGGNDGVERTLAAGECVGRCRVE